MVEQMEKNDSFNSMSLVPCDLGNIIVLHGLEDKRRRTNVLFLFNYSAIFVLL